MALFDNTGVGNALHGYVADLGASDPETDVRRLYRRHAKLDITPSTTAADNTSVQYFHRVNTDAKAVKVHYLPRGSLTANDTNFAQLIAVKADGAGGATTTIADINTSPAANGGGGNMADGVPYALTLASASTLEIDAGSVIGLKILKQGSGIAVPAGSLIVELEER